jgi:NADH-quinone oxidoreductase subunit N
MSAGVKAAAFGAILRLLGTAFSSPLLVFDFTGWASVLAVIAALTMTLGNLAAIRQDNVKRMLAYSSISHAGFVLIGVQVANRAGTSAALFYLFVYAFMAIGAFAVIGAMAQQGDSRHELAEYRGLSVRKPLLAGALTVFLLAQAGVPLTGGFVAKLGVFKAAVDAGQYPLALIAMLASVVGAFVYLRLVVTMYGGGEEEAPDAAAAVDAPTRAVLTVVIAAIIVLGILPGFVLDFAKHATLLLAR